MSPGQGLGAQTVRDNSHGDRAWQCYVSSPPACVYSSGVSLEEGPSQRGAEVLEGEGAPGAPTLSQVLPDAPKPHHSPCEGALF